MLSTVHRSGLPGGDRESEPSSRRFLQEEPIPVQKEIESLCQLDIKLLKSKSRSLILSSKNPAATAEFLKTRFRSRVESWISAPAISTALKSFQGNQLLCNNGKKAVDGGAISPAGIHSPVAGFDEDLRGAEPKAESTPTGEFISRGGGSIFLTPTKPSPLPTSHQELFAVDSAMATEAVQMAEKTKDLTMVVGCPKPQSGHGDEAPLPRHRPGKEIMVETPEAEANVVRVNMRAARRAMDARLFAVGLFLSAILINPRHLITVLKRVWKVRGDLTVRVVHDRRYLLEFTEDGDRQHAIRGGPWRYSGDAFLVEAFDGLGDPAEVEFPSIPMWVQFRGIPFYLLTKELGEALGRSLGELLRVDANARGDINDKFIRARVLLPLQCALEDTITDESVTSIIRYERLPNFCLYCGLIGHMEQSCNLPTQQQEIRFSIELRVPPVIPEDPRCWFLPATAGRALHQHRAALPWCSAVQANDTNSRQRILPPAAVEQVAKAVANLKVDAERKSQANVAQSECAAVASPDQAKIPDSSSTNDNNIANTADNPIKKPGSWKRINHEEADSQSKSKGEAEHVGIIIGMVRSRPSDIEHGEERGAKRQVYEIPTLSECLGIEGLRLLREEEENRRLGKWVQAQRGENSNSFEIMSGENIPSTVFVNDGKEVEKVGGIAGRKNDKNQVQEEAVEDQANEEDGGRAATGPGATGTLSGANVSARQGP